MFGIGEKDKSDTAGNSKGSLPQEVPADNNKSASQAASEALRKGRSDVGVPRGPNSRTKAKNQGVPMAGSPMGPTLDSAGIDVGPLKDGLKIIITGIDKILTRRFDKSCQGFRPELSDKEISEMVEEYKFMEEEVELVSSGVAEMAKKYPLFAQFSVEILAVASAVAGSGRKALLHSQLNTLAEERAKRTEFNKEKIAKDQANANLPPALQKAA